MNRLLFLVLFAMTSLMSLAQADRQYIRYGNRHFHQQNFVKAEAEYRKSLSVNPENPQALYNLGCALMMQKKDSAAVQQFEKAARVEKARMRKAKIYHNIGYVCQSNKLYGDAIKAYKESLRNNPSDDETRYNLALCKRLEKKNQNKNKKNQQNKDKEKKKEDNKKDQNQNKNEQQKQNSQERMSKDNAEQLLNAAMQNEQQTQRRIKEAMRRQKSKKLDKNW